MVEDMAKFLSRLIPFIFLGIAIVAIAFGMLLLFYLFAIGATVGLILFAISWIKDRFFPPQKLPTHKQKTGRTIDTDDWKHL